jgi:Bacterial Ig-like domain
MAASTSRVRAPATALFRVAAVAIVAMVAAPVANAPAAPQVTITSPPNNSVSNNQTPFFSGLAEEAGGPVTLRIYAGPAAGGTAVQQLSTQLFSIGGAWSLGPAELLGDGSYTAQATQTNLASETGTSSPVTFTVDTAPPVVSLNPPATPSEDQTPSFTGTASDTTPVTVQIHAGTAQGTVVSRATAAGTGGGWSSGAASPALQIGQYTAVAIQTSSLTGNPAGKSAPVSFAITPAMAPPTGALSPAIVSRPVPPVAAFRWFPPVPKTGETVSLVSSSSDGSSPITGLAWALGGPFQTGGPVLTTSFATAGAHVVQLRVTDASGLSSVTAETINVASPRAPLMQPFPVVRIAGSETASGIRLRLLRVQQLPAGARVIVRCRGKGCPQRSARRVAVWRKHGVAPLEFGAFERPLRFGLSLEILVSKPGLIGKYTRFSVRRGRLPERTDTCLDPHGRPLVCPR